MTVTEYQNSKPINKFAASILATGTILITCGFSNAPSIVNFTKQQDTNVKIAESRMISSGGSEYLISTPMAFTKEIEHGTPNLGIEYNETNKILNIILWRDSAKEGIELVNKHSEFVEKTISIIRDVKMFETPELELDDDDDNIDWDEFDSQGQLFKFETRFHSNVKSDKELTLPTLEL
jgi:hypothetical protein